MFATFGFYMFFLGWIIKPRPHLAPRLWLIVAAGQGFFVGGFLISSRRSFACLSKALSCSALSCCWPEFIISV